MAGLSDDGMNVGAGMVQLAPWMIPPDEFPAQSSSHPNQSVAHHVMQQQQQQQQQHHHHLQQQHQQLQQQQLHRNTPSIAQNHNPMIGQHRPDQQVLYYPQNPQQQLYHLQLQQQQQQQHQQQHQQQQLTHEGVVVKQENDVAVSNSRGFDIQQVFYYNCNHTVYLISSFNCTSLNSPLPYSEHAHSRCCACS